MVNDWARNTITRVQISAGVTETNFFLIIYFKGSIVFDIYNVMNGLNIFDPIK